MSLKDEQAGPTQPGDSQSEDSQSEGSQAGLTSAGPACRGEVRTVLQRGNPRLQQTAMASPTSGEALQATLDDLIATALAAQGVGIAAPQIGLCERLIIVASRPNERYPHAPQMEPTAMINPVLLDQSEQEALGWEGCLSVPDCRAQVSRPSEIRVEYFDRWGRLQRSQFSGFVARIFQHELDHLNGILFVDRVSPASCLTEAEYRAELGIQQDSSSTGAQQP